MHACMQGHKNTNHKNKKIAEKAMTKRKKLTITFHSYQHLLKHRIFSKCKMAIVLSMLHPSFFMFLFILMIITTFPMVFSRSEAGALLSLKNSFSNANALDSWVANSMPCNEHDQWKGVICYKGFVTGLRLGGMGLFGQIDIDALMELKSLRTISFMNNSFSGSIPEFNRIGYLRAMYLSGNKFSGNIPQEYFQKMRSLKKVWLSNNQFTGEIPSSLTEIPQLVELHLENNQFSGNIPNFENPKLVRINLSNNNLEGGIPSGLLRFNESSFAGNSGLCGEKFGTKCGKPMDLDAQNNTTTQPSSNSIENANEPGKNRPLQIAGIVVTCVVLISLAIFLIVKSRRKKNDADDDFNEMAMKYGQGNHDGDSLGVQVASTSVKRDADSIKKTSSSKRGSSHGGKGVGELVVVNDERGIFGLPDLMKASAEVLGNGGFGSSYKAVMANGVAVVVKRTRELNALGKDGFDAEMKKIARLKHWNLLTPLAYHFRKEEKLVISEYVPRGSLLYLLHGDRGSSHAELNWPARLKIVQGIAEGMRYLHTELASYNLPHGNLKSSNILLGPDYEPLLVDYGFIHIANPSNVTQTLFAYKAPEAAQHGQISPICDVYCFGVVILEILTGKFPSQYLSNGKGGTDVVQWVTSAISEGREVEILDPEIATCRNSLGEMEQLLHIAAACTEINPQKRLDMMEVVRRIEEIKTKGDTGTQESRTIEVLPSFSDGYADSQVVDNQGHGDQSRKRHGSDNSFGSKDYLEFEVSS